VKKIKGFIHCPPEPFPDNLMRMRLFWLLLMALLLSTAPARAQVTVDLQALDKLPGAHPATKHQATQKSKPRRVATAAIAKGGREASHRAADGDRISAAHGFSFVAAAATSHAADRTAGHRSPGTAAARRTAGSTAAATAADLGQRVERRNDRGRGAARHLRRR
jgi:hypothetical protein